MPFPENQDPRPRPARSTLVGAILLLVSVIGTAVLAAQPAPYVIESPGPVLDVLGEIDIDGEATPLIEIPDETVYPADGSLSLLTVNLSGSPDQLPSWFEIALVWFDDNRVVYPVEVAFPAGLTSEESNERGRIAMRSSQQESVAAALVHLGYEVPGVVLVAEVLDGEPASGVLELNDEIHTVNGVEVVDLAGLRQSIADNGTETPIELGIRRGGWEQTVQVTPRPGEDPDPAPVIGVLTAASYDLPVEVDFTLGNIGGPSAGLVFALGIIDKLTEGSLTGGASVAGTGAIGAGGEVAGVGGVRQKMRGADAAGADFMLVPRENCADVLGQVPGELVVVPVSTLDEAIAALESIGSDVATARLPSC